MKKHWSDNYIKFISIKIEYDDGLAQWWDFDSTKYNSLDLYKEDIARDFETIEPQYQYLEMSAKGDGKEEIQFEINRGDMQGMNFAELALEHAEAIVYGN